MISLTKGGSHISAQSVAVAGKDDTRDTGAQSTTGRGAQPRGASSAQRSSALPDALADVARFTASISAAASSSGTSATGNVVSVVGLDSSLNAPSVDDQETAQSTSTRVAIQGGASVNNLMSDASVSDKRPEIIAKTPLFSFQDSEKIEGLLYTRRFERFLKIANANLVWDEIQKEDPGGLYTTLSEKQAEVDEEILTDVKALASLRAAIDSVALAIDIRHNSSTITSIAKEVAEEGLIPSDGSYDEYPDTIEEFISQVCGFQETSVSNFSNTKLYHTLIRELRNSISRHYPTLLPTSINAREDLGAVAYGAYKPEGDNSHSISTKTLGGESGRDKRPVSQGVYNGLPGISSVSNQLDRVRILTTVLYNELTVSAGIGRSLGTSLGTRFGSTGADALEYALGGSFVGSGKVLTDQTAAGSLADFMVLNEKVGSRPAGDHIVLPFESAQITDDGGETEYVSGADFFVEAPLRFPDSGGPNTFDEFTTKFVAANEDVQTYMNDLLALDQETPLTPHGILIRCLTELFKIVSYLSEPVSSGNVPAITSFSTAMMAKASNSISSTRPYIKTRTSALDASYALGMRFREELDLQLEDDSYIPTRCKPESDDPPGTNPVNSTVSQTRGGRIYKTLYSAAWGTGNTKYSSNQTSAQYPGALITAGDPEDMSAFESFVQISRELQREAMNLAERDGASATYLDNDGFTRYNKFDDNVITACIYEIFRSLLNTFVCIDITRGTDPNTWTGSENKLKVGWDTDKSSMLRDFLEVLVTSAQSGADLDALFTEDGGALAIEGVARNIALGPTGATAGDLVDLMKATMGHRKFIKYTLANIQAISQEVSRCNNIVNELFDVLTSDDAATIDLSEVADDTKTGLIRIGRSPAGRESLKCLTRDQVSLKLVDYYRSDLDEEQSFQTELNFTTSQSERLAVDIFVNSNDITRQKRGVGLTIGFPVGMMRNLRKPKFSSSSSDMSESVPFAADPDASRVLVTVHREEELFRGVTFESIQFEFDTELFILPDGIVIEIPDDETSPEQTLNEIVETTTYSRISSGEIISQDLGLDLIDLDPTITSVLENHIKSHLFRLMMRELAGIDFSESGFLFYNELQENVIDLDGYNALRTFAKVESIRKLLGLSAEQISRVFERVTILSNRDFLKIKNSQKLKSLVRGGVKKEMNEYGTMESVKLTPVLNRANVEDAVLHSSAGLLGPVTRKTRILSPSMFDRVFTIVVAPDDFEIDDPGSQQEEIHYTNYSGNFDINGYYCEVELGE